MSNELETRVNALATRIANEFINTYGITGNVADLNTTATTLVGAINEALAASPTGVLFAASNLADVTDAAAARTNLEISSSAETAAAIATAIAAITLGSLGGLSEADVDARVQLAVGAAPAALDTIVELSAALGDDANFAATITGLLANKLDFSKPQALTVAQKLQACENAGIGNPDADYVAVFEAALVTS